jgi:hypothetical protein
MLIPIAHLHNLLIVLSSSAETYKILSCLLTGMKLVLVPGFSILITFVMILCQVLFADSSFRSILVLAQRRFMIVGLVFFAKVDIVVDETLRRAICNK